MRPRDYLKARKASVPAFAREADVPQRTMADVVSGGGCHISTARKIVEASRRTPAPDGGTITYEDLASQDERQPDAPAAAGAVR